MNHENVSRWLALGANFGVLIGLFLLIVEIRQNTEMMQSQIHQSRTDTALAEQHATYNSDYMPAIIVKAQNGEALTEEAVRYVTYFRAFNRNQDNNLWQYNQGLLTGNTPRSVRGAVRAVVGGHRLGIETWDGQKLAYTDEYVAFVEEAISDLRNTHMQ
jgi:hypothetical protein